MSKNKSKIAARKTGGHDIVKLNYADRMVAPRESIADRYDFILKITTGKTQGEIIKQYLHLLTIYKENDDIINKISKRTGISRYEIIKKLDFYSNKYNTQADLIIFFSLARTVKQQFKN